MILPIDALLAANAIGYDPSGRPAGGAPVREKLTAAPLAANAAVSTAVNAAGAIGYDASADAAAGAPGREKLAASPLAANAAVSTAVNAAGAIGYDPSACAAAGASSREKVAAADIAALPRLHPDNIATNQALWHAPGADGARLELRTCFTR